MSVTPRLEFSPRKKLLIGMVHLEPTPGAPRHASGQDGFLAAAERDARALLAGGCDALLIENFGDIPFHPDAVPPETVASLALALATVRSVAPGLPLGVNVLRNDARAALGLCAATGASFLRVNVHIGAAVTDQGVLEGRAAQTVRTRAQLCPEARLLADVHVKHAAPLAESDLVQSARETRHRGLADALVISGAGTGQATDAVDLERVRAGLPDTPLLVGSGLNPENAAHLLAHCDGAIVGTALKRGGDVGAPVDPARLGLLRRAFDAAGQA